MTAPACVLLVDDSAVVRRYLHDAFDRAEGLHVVGEARDGEEGVKLARLLRPDAIVLDIDLPGIDGVEATRRILAGWPTPILIFCARSDDVVQRGFAALEAGAMALIEKPRPGAGRTPEEAAREVVAKVRVLVGVRAARRQATAVEPPAPAPGHAPRPGRVEVVAIAASTGGPAAVATILRRLPRDLAAPVLVAQHMTPGFTDGLARWLGDQGPLPVAVARTGERPAAGRVYLAADGCNLSVKGGRLRSEAGPAAALVRPSADLLFESVAEAYDGRALAVVLTGMGDDGTAGLRALRARGGRALAQRPESCTIPSMPRSAIDAGLVDEALGLDELAARIERFVGRGG